MKAKRQADVYTFRDRMDYAVFTVYERAPYAENERGGYYLLSIEGSYGNGFAYAWTHPGKPFKAFLCNVDQWYLGNKLCSGDPQELNGEKTTAAIRRYICERRREGDLTREAARDAWDTSSIEDSHDFSIWYAHDSDWCSDPTEFAVYSDGPRMRDFAALHKAFWHMFVADLKEEIGEIEKAKAPAPAVQEAGN